MKRDTHRLPLKPNAIARRPLSYLGICIILTLCCMVTTAVAAQSEKDLIQTLKRDASVQEKEQACRELWKIGTAKSVPALAVLLEHPKLSHMARYALEPMPYPEAGKALRGALERTESEIRVGIVNSLGRRRDNKAVSALVPLLDSSNVSTVRATAIALGRIASSPALEALQRFRAEADDSLAPIAADASLRAVERCLGTDELEAAAGICKELDRPTWPGHVRLAARVALWKAEPQKTTSRLKAALAGEDAILRGQAARFIAVSADRSTVRQLANALSDLPAKGQERLLEALASRDDVSGRSTALQALESEDTGVRLSAIGLLGQSGRAEDVSALSDLLDSSEPKVREAAAASLRDLKAEGSNRAMMSELENATSRERASLIGALADRKATEAVTDMARYLQSSSDEVRRAALRGLGILGDAAQVPGIVDALKSASSNAERQAAEKALASICERVGDDALPAVFTALDSAEPETQVVLLRVLGVIEGEEALETVRRALSHENEAVRDEAARVLAGWDDGSAAPALLQLAKTAPAKNHRLLCLRGYVRMATRSSARQRIKMLQKAGELASRPQEKRLIISAWGETPTGQSLEALTAYLDDPEVRAEAASAAVKVAEKVVSRNRKAVRKAMQAVINKSEKKAFRSKARKILSQAGGKGK